MPGGNARNRRNTSSSRNSSSSRNPLSSLGNSIGNFLGSAARGAATRGTGRSSSGRKTVRVRKGRR